MRQPSAFGHQAQGIGKRQDAGDTGRGRIRPGCAPSPPPARCPTTATGWRAHTQWRTSRAVHSRSGLIGVARGVGTQHLQQPRSRYGASPSRTLIQRAPERRRGCIQLHPHPGVLRALAGEQERDLRTHGAVVRPGRDGGAVARRDKGRQTLAQSAAFAPAPRAVRRNASARHSPCSRRRPDCGVACQRRVVAPRQLCQEPRSRADSASTCRGRATSAETGWAQDGASSRTTCALLR